MKQVVWLLVLVVVVIVGVLILVDRIDPSTQELREERMELQRQQQRELAPWTIVVKKVLLGSLALAGASAAAIVAAFAITLLGGTRHMITKINVWAHSIKPTRHGAQYPALVTVDKQTGLLMAADPVGDKFAQRVAALGALEPGTRLTAGAVKALVDPKHEGYMLPDDAPPIESQTADEGLRFDLLEKPHAMIVGQTGGGKSTAAYYIIEKLSRQYEVEFVVCEPGGIDWNEDASAITNLGIAKAVRRVHEEFLRRQNMLRLANVRHISALPDEQSLPYVCLVIEEMEAVLDDLKMTNKRSYTVTLLRLRQIARMGRKTGVCLIAITQAARTDVFDSHVRTNLAWVFLFRNGQNTAEMFRVGKLVNLPALKAGEAFSLAHGHRIVFPLVADRPDVTISRLYKEDPLNPEQEVEEGEYTTIEEAEAAALAEMSDAPRLTTGARPALSEPEVATFQGITELSQLDDSQRQTIIDLWETMSHRRGRPASLRAVQLKLFGYPGGRAYEIVEAVLREYLQANGRQLPWRKT